MSEADRHFERYLHHHRTADFTAAEQAIRAAFDTDRPSMALRLGSLYEERFRAGGDPRYHRRALEILRAGWAEGSGYPLLPLSYADAVVNSGAAPAPGDLDNALEELATVEDGDLPAELEPHLHHLVMAARLRRFTAGRDLADLHGSIAAADLLVAHPEAEPGLSVEARWIRATLRLDLASITGDRMADIDPIIADLTAAAPRLNPGQRRIADCQLTRLLAERARRTGDPRDADAAEAYATRALDRLPAGTAERAETLYHLAFLLLSRAETGRSNPPETGRSSPPETGHGNLAETGRDSLTQTGRDSLAGAGRDSLAGAGRDSRDVTDRGIALLRQVVGDPAAAPQVRAVAAAQLATATASRAHYWGGDPAAVDSAISLAHDAMRATRADDLNRVGLAAALANALLLRFETRGALADLRWCLDLLRDTRDEAPGDPHRHELLLTLAQAQIMWAEATGAAPPPDTLTLLSEVVATAAPGDPRRIQALRGLAAGHAMRAQRTRDTADWRDAARYARETLAGLPSGAPFTTLMRMSAGGTLILAGRALDDLGLVREGTELIGTALGDPAGALLRGRHLAIYGMARLELHRRAPRPGDLDHAIRALREATGLASAAPGQRGAAEIGLALAAALAATGDPGAAAEAGRAALRARAWQVLLQSGTHDAMTTAARSSADALQVARAALAAGDRPGAWLALETGRGLVLHAATVAATVPELLRAAGEPDLAANWSAEPPESDGAGWRTAAPAVPGDARFRALSVLEREVTLFDPPPVAAVGAALTELGADALVYLFAGRDGTPGFALIVEPAAGGAVDQETGRAGTVSAGGRIDALDLPGLTGDWAVPAVVQEAVATRELEPVLAGSEVGRSLGEVCRAAWEVAIGPLLDRWHRGHTGLPHLVLVTDGALATVPWHAAHGAGRWAIDEAAFSYIASGRLLVDVARRPAPPVGGAGPATSPATGPGTSPGTGPGTSPGTGPGTGLVIGNPDTGRPAEDLPGAGAEATTIFRRHYAGGRFCGRPSDPGVTATGPGLPTDVFDWLAAGGSVLHLACHGVVRADGPASSFLMLAGGATVSAEQLLRAAKGHSPGLVSLAACTTHRAGRAYDEAVTLSTGFLVAGAATAIGSLWPVPDPETARLMVAFHDNLAGRGLPAHAALREAQLAMRDPGDDRTLVHWAGFVHLGR